MHRFYCPDVKLEIDQIVSILEKEEIHHLKSVLRLKEQDQISIFNRQGEEAVGTIRLIKDKQVAVRVDYLQSNARFKPVVSITMACAIPKKAKFDFIVEKCTELGVMEIFPLLTQRGDVSVKPLQFEKKLKRYHAIAVNASKQCGRRDVPVVHPVIHFSDFFKSNPKPDSLKLIPYLGSREQRKSLWEVFPLVKNEIVFLIGPEGDFSPVEIDLAIKSGCVPISLGDLILKVDTAAISVVACANSYFFHQK